MRLERDTSTVCEEGRFDEDNEQGEAEEVDAERARGWSGRAGPHLCFFVASKFLSELRQCDFELAWGVTDPW